LENITKPATIDNDQAIRMSPMSEDFDPIMLTADVVAAYVSNNNVPVADLPNLISQVHKALTQTTQPQAAPEPALVPAVSIKKSVTPNYLISLEDGKQYKSLKRHLNTRGMTPDEYRAKWGLPKDYPMVAASYSEQRSNLAKTLGLGRKAAAPASVEAPAKAARAGRGKKAG
jgi:predicted transcriptional regulator